MQCCIVNNQNAILVNKKLDCNADSFKSFITKYKHTLYMKAIHGGKAKNDNNMPSFNTTTVDAVKRIPEIVEHFENPLVKENVNADLSIIHHLKREIKRLEAKILKRARTGIFRVNGRQRVRMNFYGVMALAATAALQR